MYTKTTTKNKKSNIAFVHKKHQEKKVYVTINRSLSVENSLFDAIREGLICGFTNEFIAKKMGVYKSLVDACRRKLINMKLIRLNSYGSRENKADISIRGIANSRYYSAYWGVSTNDPEVRDENLRLPKIHPDSVKVKGEFSDKYYTNITKFSFLGENLAPKAITMDGPLAVNETINSSNSANLGSDFDIDKTSILPSEEDLFQRYNEESVETITDKITTDFNDFVTEEEPIDTASVVTNSEADGMDVLETRVIPTKEELTAKVSKPEVISLMIKGVRINIKTDTTSEITISDGGIIID